MSQEKGSIWLEEYSGNSSVVVLCYADPEGEESLIGLTKDGVEATIELLSEWIEYHDERMEELFDQLSNMESPND